MFSSEYHKGARTVLSAVIKSKAQKRGLENPRSSVCRESRPLAFFKPKPIPFVYFVPFVVQRVCRKRVSAVLRTICSGPITSVIDEGRETRCSISFAISAKS